MDDELMDDEFITKWNWGAFMNPIWFAIANRSWLLFLNLIPIFNIFWVFYGALNAEAWALNEPNNEYRDDLEFRRVMDGWNRAGLIMFIVSAIFFILYFLMFASILSAIMNLFIPSGSDLNELAGMIWGNGGFIHLIG